MKMIKEAENTKLFHLFPTHDPDCQADLNRLWVESYREIAPSNQVLDLVRDYYGEEISIYFAFLGSYTRWLVSISLLGLLVKISQLQYGVDSVLVPVYCVAVALWSILFLECWKREQAELQLRWNVRDFEDTEVDRIDFYGEIRVSPITGEDEMYFSDEQRLWKYAVTGPIMLLSMGAVVVAAIGVVIFQYFSVHSGTFGPYGSLVSGVVNAIVIQVMNKIYESLAYKMNNYENHQSQTDYDDALILKVFVFQFVNSYAAVVYMAFLAGRFTVFGINLKCTKHGCLSDIHNLIFATLMLNIITGNLIEVAVPYATFKIEEYNNLKARSEDIGGGQMQVDETSPLVSVINAINPFYDEDDEMLSRRHDEFVLPPIMSKHELEAHMPTYETTFSDYNELVIQFGYVVLFSMALPIGSLLCLINNLIEIRSDAFKLVNVFQRPFYRGAQDIGQWGLILRVMVVMGVLFNCGMMAFTSNIFLRDGWVDPSTVGVVEMLAAVFVGEHLLLMIMVICADFIPDERATLTDDEERLQEKADDVLRTKDDVDRSREKARVYREMKQLIDEHDVALLEDIQIRKWRRTKQYGTGLLSTVDPPEVQDGEKHGKPAEWLEKRERQEHRTEELKAKLFEYDLY
jgi:anoctamin-10/anoctamin-7